jgi:hypothetical protein
LEAFARPVDWAPALVLLPQEDSWPRKNLALLIDAVTALRATMST